MRLPGKCGEYRQLSVTAASVRGDARDLLSWVDKHPLMLVHVRARRKAVEALSAGQARYTLECRLHELRFEHLWGRL